MEGENVQAPLDVFQPSAQAGVRVAQAYRATGVRRSPLIARLENAPELSAGERYCLYLIPGHERALAPGRLFFTAAENSWVQGGCP